MKTRDYSVVVLLFICPLFGCGSGLHTTSTTPDRSSSETPEGELFVPTAITDREQLVQPRGNIQKCIEMLSIRHQTEIEEIESIIIASQGEYRALILFSYDGLQSWRGFLWYDPESSDQRWGRIPEVLRDPNLQARERGFWETRLGEEVEPSEIAEEMVLSREDCLEIQAEDRRLAEENREINERIYDDCISDDMIENPEEDCAEYADSLAEDPIEITNCDDEAVLERTVSTFLRPCEALNEPGEDHCGPYENRYGVALFILDSQVLDAEPSFQREWLTDGLREYGLAYFAPGDFDNDEEVEFLIEIAWTVPTRIDPQNEENEQQAYNKIDLVILDSDLSIQFNRSLVLNQPMSLRGATNYQDGRFWFERAEQETKLIIERFTVPGPCDLDMACVRFVVPPESSQQEGEFGQWYYLGPSCYPIVQEGTELSCTPEQIEHIELRYSAEQNLWI